MNFLLDTDTCVFWLRGHAGLRQRVAGLKVSELAISAVTLAELHYGAACSTHPEENHRAVEGFASALIVLGVEAQVARAFGEIKGHLRQQGRLLEDADLFIAATAQVYGLTLVTNNGAHFARIAGLAIDTWT